MTPYRAVLLILLTALLLPLPGQTQDQGGVAIDKAKRQVRIDAKVAPRKLPTLDKVYPVEVIACWPAPKGKKAHETVVTIDAKPSAVHEALVQLGLKPGTPVMGESEQPPQGPDVSVFLEVPDAAGPRRLAVDKLIVDQRTGKPFPKTVKWRFTGSVQTKPDPNSEKTVYGADESGTLIVIFPVSNQTVLQTSLTMKYEKFMDLEANKKVLPPEGTPVKLVIEAPAP